VYEDIFPSRALDESVSLRPVEPLHCTFLSHGKTPFTDREELFPDSRLRFDRLKPPSEKPVEPGCVNTVRRITPKKRKDPSVPCAVKIHSGELWSPAIWFVSTTPN
jgi:hypothetical protein